MSSGGERAVISYSIWYLTYGSGPGARISHLYVIQCIEKQKDFKTCFKLFHLKTLANADDLGH